MQRGYGQVGISWPPPLITTTLSKLAALCEDTAQPRAGSIYQCVSAQQRHRVQYASGEPIMLCSVLLSLTRCPTPPLAYNDVDSVAIALFIVSRPIPILPHSPVSHAEPEALFADQARRETS